MDAYERVMTRSLSWIEHDITRAVDCIHAPGEGFQGCKLHPSCRKGQRSREVLLQSPNVKRSIFATKLAAIGYGRLMRSHGACFEKAPPVILKVEGRDREKDPQQAKRA